MREVKPCMKGKVVRFTKTQMRRVEEKPLRHKGAIAFRFRLRVHASEEQVLARRLLTKRDAATMLAPIGALLRGV